MFIDFGSLQYLPIIVGGIVYMVYGGIYYSVVLSNKNKNHSILGNQSAGPFKYIYSIILAFINSFLVGVLIQSVGSDHFLAGVGIGFIIGLMISLVYLKNTLFGLMSKKSFLVAIGDHLIIFTLLGTIHGFFM
ncbi:DUF1761 domain-containing protein [Bacillus sp. JJ1474]|uniref:DUF1761 domain-containing protein n=1 Tax=Bacillus sp. JJ1474 TaxID=3122955 RepID=UPI003000E1BC